MATNQILKNAYDSFFFFKKFPDIVRNNILKVLWFHRCDFFNITSKMATVSFKISLFMLDKIYELLF